MVRQFSYKFSDKARQSSCVTARGVYTHSVATTPCLVRGYPYYVRVDGTPYPVWVVLLSCLGEEYPYPVHWQGYPYPVQGREYPSRQDHGQDQGYSSPDRTRKRKTDRTRGPALDRTMNATRGIPPQWTDKRVENITFP